MNEQNGMKTIGIALLGIVALVFGAADILVWAGFLDSIDVGILTIGGDDFFRWAWGGLVLACGGMLMLSGARNIHELQQCGKVVLGAILAGIIACTDIFAAFCESVPAGEDSSAFFNSLDGFVSGCAPPYSPAVLLLPFTLLLLYGAYVWTRNPPEHHPADD